jgi:hypothetical protein
MTPKEKAIELSIKFCNHQDVFKPNISSNRKAIICVDEIMMECSNWTGGSMDNGWDTKRFDYWEEVKKELEKF